MKIAIPNPVSIEGENVAAASLDGTRGYTGQEIAKRNHTSRQTASKRRGRFAGERLARPVTDPPARPCGSRLHAR